MAAVIGMIFLVVLVMALNIVESKAAGVAAASQPTTDAEVQSLRDRAQRLRDDIARTEAEIASQIERLNLASGDETGALSEVQRLEATLKNLYDRIRENQAALAAADTETQQTAAACQARRLETDRLARRADELRRRLLSVRATPRIAFLLDPHPDPLEPWLVDVAASHLRVASQDGRGTILEFGGASSDERLASLLAWLAGQNPKTHYLVLLIKPSGTDFADTLAREIKSRGFDIGVDLLPEDWEPF